MFEIYGFWRVMFKYVPSHNNRRIHYGKFQSGTIFLFCESSIISRHVIWQYLLHACWNFLKRLGDCLQRWLVHVFVTLHSAKYWMKATKLLKSKKSQLKVPVRTAGRKMQFFTNYNRRDLLYDWLYNGKFWWMSRPEFPIVYYYVIVHI